MIVAGVFAWPQLTLLFSPTRPIVDTLSHDLVWVDPALPANSVDANRIRGIIGTRPLTVVVLAPGNDTWTRPLDACTDVSDRLDGVFVMVVQHGQLGAGCERDVGIVTNEFGFDFAFWTLMDNTTAFLRGDIAAQTEQLALFYDQQVDSGTLRPTTRTFSAPLTRWLLAVVLVVAVTGGVMLAFWAQRRGVVAFQRRQARRRQWQDSVADINADLQEIALIMLDATPTAGAQDRRQLQAAAHISAEYISVLEELEGMKTGTDLTGLRKRTTVMRDRLSAAAGTKP